MSSLKDKVVIITGASSGIGAGTALHFASLGCQLVLCGRNEENLTAVRSQCIGKGLADDKVIISVGDVTNENFCQALINHAIEKFGRIDVLVNSAGILVSGGIEKVTLQDYDRQMDVNVRSVFILTKLAVPHLLESKGNIVNVSSVTGMRSFPGVVAYNMSKAAVDHLTRSVALEVASRGVRVNAVNPGVIITECHKRAGMSEADYAKFLEHSKETHALGRPGTVEEVARAIAFLASDDASYITGHTLPVDGGRNIMCPR
ncbi:3-oxoacyl-[acyl-carrier-protein] reductase FabG-like [Ischnura elegans]|uniref:3-oxoacyl-[acyl-carrier-protein] reductase FabG-like n=1 Tax=Ischnura elegans TaxID=197161 RepID=UPI001ED89304|nr:3-oxoacyl-[acyl-carrier-protein] reductase FabG-like [Ischnura elegans]XP_046385932.1 3-oxoacyl-[acyl-carrier-protein] reductase FabG-like [Ischnura elegans]XP_046385933.1 3-oxoacyl-[acyl-carrier-protein] reductase FabG-like [Ischnura elegans]XP_046385934.1 3-oxoacyl-[acyl-carrier-protein] reductase FabG-like [Ischnura elegans]